MSATIVNITPSVENSMAVLHSKDHDNTAAGTITSSVLHHYKQVLYTAILHVNCYHKYFLMNNHH